MRRLDAAAAGRCWSTCCSALRDGNPCGALLTCVLSLTSRSIRADPSVVPPSALANLCSYPQRRSTSFGVQATDYQAPPASDPSGSGQNAAQQADGSRRATERATLLPKMRIPCLAVTEAV